jgi:ankyrin repeat protein
MFSAQQGDMDAASMLLTAGADVNGATPDGDTPLLVASASGHEKLAIFLLDKGANANAADCNGITALDYTMLRALGQIGGIQVTYAYNPHMRRPDMMDLAKVLLAHGANPNARLISPARDNDTGPGYGKIQRVDHTNNGGGRISPVGATPVLLAALSRNPSMMRMLVEAGGDVRLTTAENVTPVMAAAGMGWGRRRISAEDQDKALEVIKIAVEMGSDVNAAEEGTGLTALHSAAFMGSDKLIQYLVEKGAQLDAKDVSGQTPLHKASNIAPKGATLRNLFPTNGYLKSTVELLLKLGANPVAEGFAQKVD